MKENNIVQEKSFAFAVRIIKLSKYLNSKGKEFVLSKQVLKSGTSIGANIEEAIGGQTKKDFLAKMSIAYKEARETKYWLRLLYSTGYINEVQFQSLISDIDELLRLIGSIQKSTKQIK